MSYQYPEQARNIDRSLPTENDWRHYWGGLLRPADKLDIDDCWTCFANELFDVVTTAATLKAQAMVPLPLAPAATLKAQAMVLLPPAPDTKDNRNTTSSSRNILLNRMQYPQQAPPPQQQQKSGGGCLSACLATLCCCFVCEEGCECCADCVECCEMC
ncbi:hypothetical protein N7520_005386 [Penicillium odoratum]|uniref:uncharacterized protein n=1 Tax=Penicillium odoratum TaxID=1167516 RepID=UPI0025490383|nr:uncharacterized protein N7520_005386 [Penicillium odoratum]KAJ5765827.1 hypothetical protein N7520_005386 [Penicillium odoratum]